MGTHNLRFSFHLAQGLTALPPDPPDLELELSFKPKFYVNPIGIYSVVIWTLFKLRSQSFNGLIDFDDLAIHNLIVSHEGKFDGVINLYQLNRAVFQTNCLVRAIVVMLEDMRTGPEGFVMGICHVKFHGRRIGDILLFTKKALPVSINNPLIQTPTNLSVSGQWNVAEDRHVPGLQLRWRRNGRNIPGQELLSLFVDSLTETVQHDAQEYCSYVTAVSAAALAAFHINSVEQPATGTGERSFNYAKAASISLVLSQSVVIPHKIFAEVDVELWENGIQIAEGFIIRLDGPGRLTNATRTAVA